MVAIPDDPDYQTPRGKSTADGKTCYCVNIRINKSPRSTGKQTKDGGHPRESTCLPVSPPPVKEFPCWDHRKEIKSNEGRSGKRPTKDKAEVRRTREYHSQTDSCRRRDQACDPIEVPRLRTCESGTQCGGAAPLTHSYCQTDHKPGKHFGSQTHILEKATRHCQTDVDQHNDTDTSHNRSSCKKPCCAKEEHQKHAYQQDQASGPGPPNKPGRGKCCCRGRAPPEIKQSAFPFIGRTPSGNFKVAPSMVSFANNEFGILAANPQSARITVRKLETCESSLAPNLAKEFPTGVPPNRKYACSTKQCCILKQQQQFQNVSHLTPLKRVTSDEGYKTPRGVSPPRYHMNPPFPGRHDDRSHHPHHPHDNYNNNYYKDYLETAGPQPPRQMSPPPRAMMEPNYRSLAPIPHNEHHHHPTDQWNYVDPKYSRFERQLHERLDNHGHHEHHPREPRYPGDDANITAFAMDQMHVDPRKLPQYGHPAGFGHSPDLGYNTQWNPFPDKRYEDPRSLPQHRPQAGLEQLPEVLKDPAQWNPFLEKHLETGLTTYKQMNDIKNTFDKYHQNFRDVGATPQPDVRPDYPEVQDRPKPNPVPKPAPFAEHFETGLSKLKEMNTDDMQNTFGNYFPNLQGFGAKQQPDKTKEPEVGANASPVPNNISPEHHLHQDPAVYTYRREEGHHHNRHVPDSDQHHQGQHEPHHDPKQENSHPPQTHHGTENDHFNDPHHEDTRHDHPRHSEDTDPEHHHHQHHHHHHEHRDHHQKHDNKNNPVENQEAPQNVKNGESSKKEGRLSWDSNNPEKSPSPKHIPLKPKETIFQLIEPDSHYQLATTSESDDDFEPPTSATDMMGKEEFQKGVDSKRKRSSGYLYHEDDALFSVLPNLDTVKGVVLLFGGANPKMPHGPGNGGRSVHMYARETDKWTKVGLLPNPRTNFGLAKVGTHVYLIGGTDPQTKGEDDKNVPVSTVYRLDLRTGEWDTLKDLDQERSHFGCVAVGQHIYIIGGNVGGRASKTCIVYDTTSDTYRPVAHLGIERSNMGIVAYGTGVMIAGGTTRDPERPVLETVTCYDPAKNRWTPWASLPSPRAFCSLVVSRTKIYLVAGAGMRDIKKRGNYSLADVLCYNEGTDEWEEVGMISTPRHGHTAVALIDNIIVIGGVSSHTMGALDSVEIFSPSTGMTSIVKSINLNKSGMVALAL